MKIRVSWVGQLAGQGQKGVEFTNARHIWDKLFSIGRRPLLIEFFCLRDRPPLSRVQSNLRIERVHIFDTSCSCILHCIVLKGTQSKYGVVQNIIIWLWLINSIYLANDATSAAERDKHNSSFAFENLWQTYKWCIWGLLWHRDWWWYWQQGH